jgi:protease-4
MGSVAASGGYWIAMGADEIWASATSLTGSIGVGSAFPTFDRALARLGIHIDGLGTTELAGQMDPLQGLGEDFAEYLRLSVGQTYREFVSKIAEHRAMDPADVYASAEGRVWIGSEAERRGLVDQLGGLESAIESAAALAGLEPGNYSVEKLEPELGWAEMLALQMVRVTAPVLPVLGVEPVLPASLSRLIDAAVEPLAFFETLNDPRGIYVYCFCDVN